MIFSYNVVDLAVHIYPVHKDPDSYFDGDQTYAEEEDFDDSVAALLVVCSENIVDDTSVEKPVDAVAWDVIEDVPDGNPVLAF